MAASSSYKLVILGGGNSAGYVARALVASGSYTPGDACIIGDEPVSGGAGLGTLPP